MSTLYVGQKNDPFILNMNLNDTNKNKFNGLEKVDKEKYIPSVSSRYMDEITALKNYIRKMNLLVRKNLNLENYPSLEEGFNYFSRKMKNEDPHSEKIQETINKWMDQILNVDFMNPLISLYEKYISDLEDELKNSKEKNNKYEKKIVDLIKENNELRDKIQTVEEELKTFLEVRNESGDSSSIIIMDRNYIMKLEERNQLLNKENEILILNYNKLQNDFMKIKNGAGSKGNELNNSSFIQLNNENLKLKNDYKELIGQYDIINQKIKEISDKNNELEIENQNIKDENEKIKYERNALKEGNERYKNLLEMKKNNV